MNISYYIRNYGIRKVKLTPAPTYNLIIVMNHDEIKSLLLKIASDSDHAAFKKIYFFYYRKLLQLAQSFCHTSEVAEEIVDDVFAAIWQKRANLLSINNLTVYLYVSVKNQSLNHLSKATKIRFTDIGEIDVEFVDPSSAADQHILYAELLHMINQGITKLPPQSRLVYKLVKEDGLKYREVADILDISIKTVEYHVGYALKKIAEVVLKAGSTPRKLLRDL